MKNTRFEVSPRSREGIGFVRTANAMFLHGGNFLECEAGCIYHEGEFCRIDSLDLITFYGDDEKDEKDDITGRKLAMIHDSAGSQSRTSSIRGLSGLQGL